MKDLLHLYNFRKVIIVFKYRITRQEFYQDYYVQVISYSFKTYQDYKRLRMIVTAMWLIKKLLFTYY